LVADLSVANMVLKKPELGLLERRRYGWVSAKKKREVVELVPRRTPQAFRMRKGQGMAKLFSFQ
jgi:hypothetical protein